MQYNVIEELKFKIRTTPKDSACTDRDEIVNIRKVVAEKANMYIYSS